MNKKKTIAVAIILALVLMIGGMLAYFTDTDTKQNVFTLGDNVNIKIEEVYDPTKGDKIHPGAEVEKAPSILNESATTPAYVFAEVTVPCYATEGTTANAELFEYAVNVGWTEIKKGDIDTKAKTRTYVYAYGSDSAMTKLEASTKTTTPVFSKVTLVSTLTKEQKATAKDEPNIDIKAYGIQTDNLKVTAPLDIFGLFSKN